MIGCQTVQNQGGVLQTGVLAGQEAEPEVAATTKLVAPSLTTISSTAKPSKWKSTPGGDKTSILQRDNMLPPNCISYRSPTGGQPPRYRK